MRQQYFPSQFYKLYLDTRVFSSFYQTRFFNFCLSQFIASLVRVWLYPKFSLANAINLRSVLTLLCVRQQLPAAFTIVSSQHALHYRRYK